MSIVPLEKHVRRTRMGSDADLLSYLFGIAQLKPNCKDNPFLNTANRENSEVLKQRLVNDAFLNLVEGSQTNLEDQPILRLLLDNLKNYFVYDVSPSGVFPSFRIGDQPYGIVPVCDFKNLKFRKGDPLYLVRNLMLFLADKWNDLAENVVISEQNMYQSKGSRMTTEERYLQAVGGTPYSTSFYERKWVEDPELLDPAFFDYLDKGSEAPVATDKMSKEEREARKKKARDDKNKGIQKQKDDRRTTLSHLLRRFDGCSVLPGPR